MSLLMNSKHALLLSIGLMALAARGEEPVRVSPPLSQAATGTVFSAERVLESMSERLQGEFDRFLVKPAVYKGRVLKECGTFPEGKLYSYVLPAMGYANLAFREPKAIPHAKKQMKKLLDLAIPQVASVIQPPNGDLTRLRTYQNHGTFLGTLNLGLGSYRLVTGDRTYDALHKHLSDILYQAILSAKGKPIRSYPGYSWHFDTIMALASLDLRDRALGTRALGTDRTAALAESHFRWLTRHATDRKTGLPYSRGWRPDGRPRPPRGCDLSMQICLLAQFAPRRARDIYGRYVRAHWVDGPVLSGFSEWPVGTTGRADVDSGPIIMGIGLTGTSMAIGTTQAMDDKTRLEKLATELAVAEPLMKLMASDAQGQSGVTRQWFKDLKIAMSPEYVTGFLYGDASLFYAITWAPYPFGKKKVTLRDR